MTLMDTVMRFAGMYAALLDGKEVYMSDFDAQTFWSEGIPLVNARHDPAKAYGWYKLPDGRQVKK